MTKKGILEKAKSKEELWVLERNMTLEKTINSEFLTPEKIYSPMKIFYNGNLIEIILFSKKGTPVLFAYSTDQVELSTEDGEVVLSINGERKFHDSYPEPEETREQFLEHFFHCWNLTPEEHKRYGIEKDTGGLTILRVDRYANKLD